MIDDIQFLANKPKVQEEFLHLLNALFEQRKQIILTSDVLPKISIKLTQRLNPV